MRLKLFTLAAAALLAASGGAARAQKTAPASADMAVGRQSGYRPARAGFLLQGPVRSVKEEDFNLHPDGAKVFTGNMTLRFDRQGRLVQLLMGNRQMEDLYDDRFSYGGDGRLAAKERRYERRPESRDVYVYADARRVVEVLTYNTDGALAMRVSKFYDERGAETRSEMEFPGAKGETAPAGQVVEMIHVYDEKGEFVSTTVKPSADRPGVLFTHRREAGGRLVTTMKYSGEAAAETFVTTATTRDARGELLSTESHTADGKPRLKVVYERKHDAHGNWVEERIRQTEWRDGGVFDSEFLRSRTITYF
jgi:hypothetical protein